METTQDVPPLALERRCGAFQPVMRDNHHSSFSRGGRSGGPAETRRQASEGSVPLIRPPVLNRRRRRRNADQLDGSGAGRGSDSAVRVAWLDGLGVALRFARGGEKTPAPPYIAGLALLASFSRVESPAGGERPETTWSSKSHYSLRPCCRRPVAAREHTVPKNQRWREPLAARSSSLIHASRLASDDRSV